MISARSAGLTRGGRTVLSDVSLDLRGELTVAVGPNGAGKSTLLKLLSGGLAPNLGTITFQGKALHEWDAARLSQHRAVLSQSLAMSFPFSVTEVVELPLQTVAAGRRRQISAQSLAEVGLLGFENRIVQQLSGGEQQRVHLARVLSQLSVQSAPHFLFLDEPTSSLDIRHQVEVLKVVRRRVTASCGAFVVLHDLTLAAAIADRLLIVVNGRIAADGPPAEVMEEGLLSAVYGISMSRAVLDGRMIFHPEMLDLNAR
ncbi:heme ABC transporter ATP-binding protein [Aestuariivirga sp.]|uniref:heme ABC transporter ATP-binding protein n=1 Tax=Aestuariivirga sp. TaxID=2650926 RepID=UPI003BAC7680